MADTLSPEDRSALMGRVKGRDTKPERVVRSLLHRMGYRFRLHRADLPGKPDIVLPKYKKVIFVHGCFWHQHPGCKRAKRPSTRSEFWNAKLDANVRRDKETTQKLRELGWDVLIVWECATSESLELRNKLLTFLS